MQKGRKYQDINKKKWKYEEEVYIHVYIYTVYI